jgi:hypothetical protein
MKNYMMADAPMREFWFSDEFLPRFVERLSIVLNCLKNKTEIQEADMTIVEEAHRTWFEDRLGWRKEDTTAEKVKVAVQTDLFDSQTVREVAKDLTEIAIKEIGTEIVTPKRKSKKRKRK